MPTSVHDAYLENRILAAPPLELVCILYQAAQNAVRDGRTHLAAGNIAARSASISRAIEIMAELAASLDHQAGGDLSRELAGLYSHMQRQLVKAMTTPTAPESAATDSPRIGVRRALPARPSGIGGSASTSS